MQQNAVHVLSYTSQMEDFSLNPNGTHRARHTAYSLFFHTWQSAFIKTVRMSPCGDSLLFIRCFNPGHVSSRRQKYIWVNAVRYKNTWRGKEKCSALLIDEIMQPPPQEWRAWNNLSFTAHFIFYSAEKWAEIKQHDQVLPQGQDAKPINPSRQQSTARMANMHTHTRAPLTHTIHKEESIIPDTLIFQALFLTACYL